MQNGRTATIAGTARRPLLLRIKHDRAILVLDLQEQVDWIRDMRGDDDPFPWQPPDFDPTPGLSALVDDIRSRHELDGRTWDEYPGVES